MTENRYPEIPGARKGSPETAFEAAAEMADAARSREKLSLRFIGSMGATGATADEVAAQFGWERYSSRPRLSTLRARKEIVPSGERRKGESGKGQAVWVLPEFGPPPADDPQLSLPGAA